MILALCAMTVRAAVPAYPAGNGVGFQDSQTTMFGGKGVAFSVIGSVISNAQWFATSANAQGTPRIQFLDASSDLTNAVATFYITTNSWSLTNSAAANATQFQVATNAGLATNDILLLWNKANDSYQMLVTSNLSATVIGTYNSATNASAVGDVLFKMSPASSVALTFGPPGPNTFNRTLSASSAGLFAGQLGKPVLVVVTGTTTVTINSISGDYWVRPRF